MRRTQQWVRLERLEGLLALSPAVEPSEPQIDLHKVIHALLALAEGQPSLADALSPEERRYMEDRLPPLSALQALLRHLGNSRPDLSPSPRPGQALPRSQALGPEDLIPRGEALLRAAPS